MPEPTLELADIFRQHGPAYRQAHSLPLHQHRLMQAIETCRTAVMGGSVEWCDHCQYTHIRYRSYFGAGREGTRPTCIALAPMHGYVHLKTGQANDGVVAMDSARYGELQQPFWRCDHADMVGHNLDTADLGGFAFDHLAAFDEIISRL